MVEPYTKSPLAYDAQLRQLKERGLIIEDDEVALSCLKSISYYRLSAYWHPFRKINQDRTISDNFNEGTQFSEVLQLYEFDRRLRLLLLDAIERIEVFIRAQFSYQIGCKYGTFGHTEAVNFHSRFDHARWLNNIEKESERSREKFITHYKIRYNSFPTLPVWMVTEVMSMGALSVGYWGLKHTDKRIISRVFSLNHMRLTTWLRALHHVRNICSHHGRLWNRELEIRPRITPDNDWSPAVELRDSRVFCILFIVRYLLRNADIGTDWNEQCDKLLKPTETIRKWRAAMGIPDNWLNHQVWQ